MSTRLSTRQINIDAKSIGSYNLLLYAYAEQVGEGTGFVVKFKNQFFLITNYHVLSGKHPDTGKQLPTCACIPDRVLIPVLSPSKEWTEGFPCWRPLVQRTLDEDGNDLWVEHPIFGRQFDVVALPLAIPFEDSLVYDIDPGPDFAIFPGSEVSIVGFPEGLSGPSLSAIWKSGSIASEVNWSSSPDNLANQFFYIDSNTRAGMSGSPVLARRFGAGLNEQGGYSVFTGCVDRKLGVYAGRAYEAKDMTIGRVWKWAGVQEIVKAAWEKVRRGESKPEVSTIGFNTSSRERLTMTRIKVTAFRTVKVQGADGQSQEITVSVLQLFLEKILLDQRFGHTLDLVRLSAQLEAQLAAAETGDGWIELDLPTHDLVKETLTNPTPGYNPAVARVFLPLIEYIIAPDDARLAALEG